MRRTQYQLDHRKVVTVYDPVRGESVSFTCYPFGAEGALDVARRVHEALPSGWAKTSLHDRRHKRR